MCPREHSFAQKLKHGLEYNVKWKGYSAEENTWEPCGNLAECEDLIGEYYAEKSSRQYKNKKKREQEQQKQMKAAKRNKTSGGGAADGAAADPQRAAVAYTPGPLQGKLMKGLFAHHGAHNITPSLKETLEGPGDDSREKGLLHQEFKRNFTVKGRFYNDGYRCHTIVYTEGESSTSAAVAIAAVAGVINFNTLLVFPQYRGRGLAKRIVHHVVDVARNAGKKEVKVMCTPKAVAGVNEGVPGASEPFWESCGFVRMKTQDPGFLKKQDPNLRRCKMRYVIAT